MFNSSKNRTPNRKIKVDNKDKQIMEMLAIDGRQPFSKIAKKINMSVSNTIKRYEKLKRNNLLKVVIQIDPTKKDFSLSVEGRSKSWDTVRKELDKCVMLCANCHRIRHEKGA